MYHYHGMGGKLLLRTEDRTSSYRLFYRTLHDYCISLIACLFICHTYWTLSDNISIWFLPDNKDKCYWHLKHVGACQKGWSKVDLCCSLFLFRCHALCLWWHVLVIHVSFYLTGSCWHQPQRYMVILWSILRRKSIGAMLTQ